MLICRRLGEMFESVRKWTLNEFLKKNRGEVGERGRGDILSDIMILKLRVIEIKEVS